MSYIAIDAAVNGAAAKTGHVWRDDSGQIHGTVYVSASSATAFFFDSAEDARGIAAKCTEIAEAMEALAADPVTPAPETPEETP